jgi:hypothetical protein
VLGGVGIQRNHAYFQQNDDGFIFIKANDDEALEHISINGDRIQQDDTGVCCQRLFHMDRVLFGSNTIFVFKYPLLKRKMFQIRSQLLESNPGL